MLHQSIAIYSRPNSLSVKIQSDITRIYAERWGPPRSRGRGERERGGWGEGEKESNPHSPPTLVHLSGNEILSGLETVVGAVYLWCHTLVSELQQAHCSTAFQLMSKALTHNRAEMYLKMFCLIDTEYRKPHGRTLPPNTQRMQVCILNPCCKRITRSHLH